MKIINKLKILFILLMLFMCCKKTYAITQQEAGEIIAQFAINFYNNFADETIYSVTGYTDNLNGQRAIAYIRGQKTSGLATPASSMRSYMKPTRFTNKYAIDCVGFVSFCIHHSLGIGNANRFTSFVLPTMYSQPSQGFYKVTDGSRKPGDILASSGHVTVYIGNGEIIDSAGMGKNYSISRRKASSSLAATFRITPQAAANIDIGSTTVQFQGKGDSEYSFEGSSSESQFERILSGTPPTHWTEKCRDYRGYYSWTNVSYVSVQEDTDEISSDNKHIEINTGSETIDTLLDAATGELGFKEGSGNNTKFGKWYGMNNQPWCAMFVSWCADKAEMLGSIIPKYASCKAGVDWYKKEGRFYLRSEGYLPKAGDVFFTSTNNTYNGLSHTGLVLAYKDGFVYTIEGNYNNGVSSVRRPLGSIYGFGSSGGSSTGTVPDKYSTSSGGSVF